MIGSAPRAPSSWLGVVVRARHSRASASTSAASSRFNSWDALVHPLRVADVVQEQLSSPAARIGGIVELTGFLLVGYLVVYSLATA